jgi:hypothetical protein
MQPMPAVPRPGIGSAAGKAFESGKAGFEKAMGGKAAAGKIFESGKAGYKQALSGKAAAGKSFESGMAAFNGWKAQLAAIDKIFDAGMEGIKGLLGSQSGSGEAKSQQQKYREAMKKHAAAKAVGKQPFAPSPYPAGATADAKSAGKVQLTPEGKALAAKQRAVTDNRQAQLQKQQFAMKRSIELEKARRIQDPRERAIAMQKAMAMKPPNG